MLCLCLLLDADELSDERMQELGNPYVLVPIEGSDHYLGGDRDTPYSGYVDEAILERTDAFLR